MVGWALALTVVVRATADTVTVGDPFVVWLWLAVPAKTAAEFAAPQLPSGLEWRRPPVVRRWGSWVGLGLPLRAWVPGATPPVAVAVRLRGPEPQVRSFLVPLPFVASVLPHDSSRWRPQPARGVFPRLEPVPRPSGWRLVLLVLSVMALVALAMLRKRRRRRVMEDPCAALLRRWPDLVAAVESGHARRACDELARGLRRCLAPDGDRRTTAELLARHVGSDNGADATLVRALTAADRVRFGREARVDLAREALDAAALWLRRRSANAPR